MTALVSAYRASDTIAPQAMDMTRLSEMERAGSPRCTPRPDSDSSGLLEPWTETAVAAPTNDRQVAKMVVEK